MTGYVPCGIARNHFNHGGKNDPIEPACPRLSYPYRCYLPELTGFQSIKRNPAYGQHGASRAYGHATGSIRDHAGATEGSKENSP